MSLTSDTYFHGTDAESIRQIMNTGVIVPNQNGEMYFSRFNWTSCLQYGADRRHKLSFVVKVRVQTPGDASKVFVETPGVRDTAVIRSMAPIPATVLELYVRSMGPRDSDEPAQLQVFRGEEAIRTYLNTLA